MAEQAAASVGYNLSLFGDLPAVPDANTLLSLKMLKEANEPAFRGLAQEQTRFLSAALALLKQDHFLRVKLGGSGLSQAMVLSQILKKRAEERHLQNRLDHHADAIQKGFREGELGNALPVVQQPVLGYQNGGNAIIAGGNMAGANRVGVGAGHNNQWILNNAVRGRAIFVPN